MTSPFLRRSFFLNLFFSPLKHSFGQCTEDQQPIPLPIPTSLQISSINFPSQVTKRGRVERVEVDHVQRSQGDRCLPWLGSQHRHAPFSSSFIDLMTRLEQRGQSVDQ